MAHRWTLKAAWPICLLDSGFSCYWSAAGTVWSRHLLTVIGLWESDHMDVILCSVWAVCVFLWGDTARSPDMGEPATRSRAVGQPADPRLLPLRPNDLTLCICWPGFKLVMIYWLDMFALYKSPTTKWQNKTLHIKYIPNVIEQSWCNAIAGGLTFMLGLGQWGSGCGCQAKPTE